jgi:predicted permease
MLSGRTPFEGTTTEAVVSRRFLAPPPPLRDFAPEVPWAVESAVARAMEFDPARRHAGAGEFARALSAGARDVSGALARLSVGTTRAIGTVRRRLGGTGSLSFGSSLMDSIAQDLAHAWRGIRRAPGFALVVILTLGLALGANATMFGITDRLLLQPPAGIGEPDEIRRVLVARWINGLGEPSASMSYPNFVDLRDRGRSFAQVAAMSEATYSLGLGAEARPVRVMLVTGQYFPLLRVPPFLGRYLGEAEDVPPSGMPVAVLSYAFWQAGFGGDSGVIGRAIPLGNRSYTVIGVAPRGFNGTELAPVDLWIPLSTRADATFEGWRESRGAFWLESIARLDTGVSAEAAELDATRASRLAHLEDRDEFHRKAEARLVALSGGAPSGATAGTLRMSVWLLSVAAVLLLIACANVANLMLARGLTRRGEIAVRLALGVSRGRLFRQLLTESLLLAALGGLAGLAIARWSADLIRAILLPDTAWSQGPLNSRVLAVTVASTLFCALVAGLFPLWRGTRGDLATQLHGGMRSTPSHSRQFRGGLLLLQTSLCTALLIGAGLFLRSVRQVRDADLGFRPRELALVSVDLESFGASRDEITAFYRQAIDRLRSTPGIAAVGASIGAPFISNYGKRIQVAGMDSMPRLAGGGPYYVRVTAGTLDALGVRLVRGRLLTAEDDRLGAEPVTVVTERTARLLWPERNPLGECLLVGQERTCHRVAGIIADLHLQSLDEDAENARPSLLFFTPLGLAAAADAVPEQLLVRTTAPLEEALETVRRALLSLRPDLPYVRMLSYQERIDGIARSWQLGASLLTVFGGLSLLIAAIGLYGVLSYAVTQRRQELGIRSALGATPESLMRLVVQYGVVAAGVGVALGAGLALAVSGRLQPLLFRTEARDPLVFAATAALVLVIALAASVLPGRRATRADPLEALRAD